MLLVRPLRRTTPRGRRSSTSEIPRQGPVRVGRISQRRRSGGAVYSISAGRNVQEILVRRQTSNPEIHVLDRARPATATARPGTTTTGRLESINHRTVHSTSAAWKRVQRGRSARLKRRHLLRICSGISHLGTGRDRCPLAHNRNADWSNNWRPQAAVRSCTYTRPTRSTDTRLAAAFPGKGKGKGFPILDTERWARS